MCLTMTFVPHRPTDFKNRQFLSTEIGSCAQVTSREIVAATAIAALRFFVFEAVHDTALGSVRDRSMMNRVLRICRLGRTCVSSPSDTPHRAYPAMSTPPATALYRASGFVQWPITSASKFGPRPLLSRGNGVADPFDPNRTLHFYFEPSPEPTKTPLSEVRKIAGLPTTHRRWRSIISESISV
jgi:hypothetical protein